MIVDLMGYGAFFLSTALIFALITLGLNLQWGLTGLFNVGIAGFVAIGAYTSAILTTPDAFDRIGGFGWPIAAGWVGAAGIAAVAAAFTGYATLRLKADYLAITTFGVAVVVQLVALNAQRLTGGPFGVAFIPRPFAAVQDQPERRDALQRKGVEVVIQPQQNGRPDLAATLDLLGRREANEVWIEAGATLAGAFVRELLFDELVVYIAPTLLGPQARPLLELPALAHLDARVKLRFTECVPVGDDLRITAVRE